MKSTKSAKQRVDLPILFEDEAMLVVDKPEGIAVHGGSGVSFGVIEALRRQRPQAKFLELAHRLDRETSGILLVGKKRLALTALHDMFREHGAGADKRYLVLVKGRWMNNTQHVKLPLHKYLTENWRAPCFRRCAGQGFAHRISPAGPLAGDEPARGAIEDGADASDSRSFRRTSVFRFWATRNTVICPLNKALEAAMA